MYRRLYPQLAAVALLPALAGCAQMTRHANAVIFGTNTMVGLRVGTAATEMPSIELGYARQEAVVMPVVANTDEGTKNRRLKPCNLESPVRVVAGDPTPPNTQPMPRFATHPCLLVATNDEKGAKDSYSVLASFGANFTAGSETGKANAQGGVAQYFATGMAAQLLALNGGASVVAAGASATKAAERAPITLDGEYVPSPANKKAGEQLGIDYDAVIAPLIAAIRAKPAKLTESLAVFETAVGSKAGYATQCRDDDPAACAKRVEDNATYLPEFNSGNRDAFKAAVDKFPSVK